MNSYRTSKLNFDRPGSSARVYDYENSNDESTERRSKIPKMPKRTYSLEGKNSSYNTNKKPNARSKTSTTSMIPRPEWKKQCRKIISSNNEKSGENFRKKPSQPTMEIEEQLPIQGSPFIPAIPYKSPSSGSPLTLENKVNRDLVSFKNNVLRIPEYWTEAGESVTGILKNAIGIITKQYPTADVESFEKDIESILKATEVVKQQILTRTENIINKANSIYAERNEKTPATADEELKKITRKIADLKSEVYHRKNVFGDLLKYGSEMKELIEIEKALKQKALQRESRVKDSAAGSEKNDNGVGGYSKHSEGKKRKVGTETVIFHSTKTEKHSLQSCGDARQGTKILLDADTKSEVESKQSEEKATQTIYSWCEDLRAKEKDIKELNRQMIELHELCRDHIAKFKNFNLQIKMRGICNKAQHFSGKEIYMHTDERVNLEKNNLACYSKDLESAIKQKDLDLHHKEKLINQQKKLLHVRDELIGMLKSRCNLEEQRRY